MKIIGAFALIGVAYLISAGLSPQPTITFRYSGAEYRDAMILPDRDNLFGPHQPERKRKRKKR